MTPLTPEDLRAALPEPSSVLALPGLERPITLYRDRHGIPHVRAETEHDASLGQGFAHAQDRLWQMECDRRRCDGRWSELVGPEGLEQDRMMRRFQIRGTLEQDYEALAFRFSASHFPRISGVSIPRRRTLIFRSRQR